MSPHNWASIAALTLLAQLFGGTARADSVEDGFRARLQWLDPVGELVELDWPTSVEAVWDNGLKPKLRVEIEVPEDLKISIAEDAWTRLVDTDNGRKLVLETRSPELTRKIDFVDGEGQHQKIGLLAQLLYISPHVLLHDSCRKAGVTVRQASDRSDFLFLAARCEPGPGQSVRVSLALSDDALAPDAAHLTRTLRPRQPRAAILAKNRLGTEYSSFELALGAPPPSHPPVRLRQPPSTSPRLERPQRALALGASQTFSSWGPQAQSGLELHARGRARLFEGEARLPAWSWQPRPFRVPATGLYELAARLPLPLSSTPGPALRLTLLPGVALGGMQVESRPEASGFLAGPELVAAAEKNITAWGDRMGELRLGVAPLLGNAFSWKASAEASIEAIKGGTERRWDLLLQVDYLHLGAHGSSPLDFTRSALGVRTWY